MNNKILIVEDDQIVANIYRNKFTLEGFVTETAADGEAGLGMMRSFRPDAVLLDLMLPKVSGIEFMKQIRAEAGFEHLPVIVFSNTYLTNMVQEAWKAGATKCLSKSNCTPKNVIEAVRSALNVASRGAAKPVTPIATPPGTPPQPKAPKAGDAPPPDADAEFQAELRATFVKSLPATLTSLRASLQGMIKAADESTRGKQIYEMYRRIHALTANAAISGVVQITQMADALEALLKELHEKPKNVNTSTLRTIASTIDLLTLLFEQATRGAPEKEYQPPTVLVVDDEAISRRAVTYALDKAKLKSTAIEDPLHAYKLLSSGKYDLVFLDVDMPNMNGFELCSKLRMLPGHKKTPVVFVTSLTDLESRANSMMSGGNDFIAKPFLFIELTVKALGHVFRNRLESAKKVPA